MTKYLIYDEHCPMCKKYSAYFVKLGILRTDERLSFTDAVDQGILEQVDQDRARNEIPLFIPDAKLVLYGTDSIAYLVSQKARWTKHIYRFPPMKWLVKKLYRFISMNRRVMAGTICEDGQCDFKPKLSLTYRLAYITLGVTICTLITLWYGRFWEAQGVIDSKWRMLGMCGAGWVLTGLIAAIRLRAGEFWEYLGNLNTIMIVGVVLLIPGIILGDLLNLEHPAIAATGISFITMLHMHYQRSKSLRLNQSFTVVWMLTLLSTFLLFGWI